MKQRKLIQKVKRFLAGVIVAAMAITMFPTVPIIAAETQEAYPYTLFAGSSAEGAITVKGNACVNGKIATNGTAVFWGSSNNINGIITEHAGESMVDISAKLDKIYFVAENVEHVSGNYISEEVNCNISKPVNVQGTVEVKGNVNLNAPLKAAGDITVKADSLNANNAVLYSKEGDIFITGNNVS